MSLAALLSSMGENTGIFVLTILFTLLCISLLWAYFHFMKPQKGTLEWMHLYSKKEFSSPELISLSRKDIPAYLVCILISGGIFVLRMLLHMRQGYIPSARWEGPSMLLSGLLLPLLLCSCYYFLFRMFYGCCTLAVLLSILACSLNSSSATAHMLLAASLGCLYIWVCSCNREPKYMDILWLLISGILYGLCLMVCWAAFYLFPIYGFAYITGKVYQWHHGNWEKKKERLLLSCLMLVICLGIGALTLWFLYCMYSSDTFYLWNVLLSGETYRSIVPTFMKKFSDISLPQVKLVSTIYGDIYSPILFLTALPPLLHGVLKKRSGQALAVAVCTIPFILMWAMSGVQLMSVAYLLCVGWMFRGFEERGYKVFEIIGSIAVILFYFLRLLLV